MSEPDWESLRRDFPLTSRFAYLNHAAMGPLSLTVSSALESFLKIWREGIAADVVTLDFSESLRRDLSSLIEADREEIAFTESTSEGLIRIAESFPFQRGDNMVLPANEFPSNVYPWTALRSKGVEIRFAGNPNHYVREEEILNACDERTRLVSVSYVSFYTGYRMDLKRLAKACHDRGVQLAVDAMQATGVMKLRCRPWKIDYLAFEGAKWIHAPSGTGVLFVARDRLSELDIQRSGWRSVVRSGLDDLLDYELPPYEGARRLEGGSHAILGHMAMQRDIETILEIGIDKIEERVIELSRYLAERLTERGADVRSCLEPAHMAGIIVFAVDHPEETLWTLQEKDVIVSLRGGLIRASVHYFNNKEDIDRLVELI